MMACKNTSSTTLLTLAWAARDEVFKVTNENNCGADGSVSYYRLYGGGQYVYWPSAYSASLKTATCNNIQCQMGHCKLDLFNQRYTDWYTIEDWADSCYDFDCNSCDSDTPTVSLCGNDYRSDCWSCDCNGGSCTGNTVNGVKWYRNSHTWGFANADSTINLNWVDVGTGLDSERLSLNVNTNEEGFEGAYRCGSTKQAEEYSENLFDSWELVFYHANQIAY